MTSAQTLLAHHPPHPLLAAADTGPVQERLHGPVAARAPLRPEGIADGLADVGVAVRLAAGRTAPPLLGEIYTVNVMRSPDCLISI